MTFMHYVLKIFKVGYRENLQNLKVSCVKKRILVVLIGVHAAEQ
jgi:hypothetical protein